MESVKVHGIFWNEGDIIAKNLTAMVIFTDAAHNKVVRKNVPVGGDLLPNKGQFMEFDSEYLRERTVPKTAVNVAIQFDWMENGQLKTTETLLSSDEPDSPDKGNNNTGKLIYGNATVEGIEIIVLESFPVQIKVNARGYLPDGCTKIDEITKEKKDSTFFVKIKTVRPDDIFCTEAIVPFQEVISLDVYGRKAGKYNVDVNGIKGTFELGKDNVVRE
jgi:inhibitor of cysteine peptidase